MLRNELMMDIVKQLSAFNQLWKLASRKRQEAVELKQFCHFQPNLKKIFVTCEWSVSVASHLSIIN